ncbi:MAG: CorA family divalent cation transporter [Bdellovibrionota bacterium]
MEKNLVSLESLAGEHAEELTALLSTGEHPSVFEDYVDFQVLLVRKILIADNSLSFSTEAFLIKKRHVFIYERSQRGFLELKKGHQDMLKLLEGYYVENQKVINGYSDEIEKLEDSLFERQVPSYFMDVWFDLKKDLAKVENFYYRNLAVYKEFYKKCESSFNEKADEFKDIEDLINFQSSNLVSTKVRMDSLHHYYDSIKSERLNKTLLALTLISGVFLPLNLIVGFFGMNTNGLFFKEDPTGTQNVLAILIGIIVLALIGIPIIKLFDKYFFRFLLGRYDFYKNISKKIEHLDEHLKVK